MLPVVQRGRFLFCVRVLRAESFSNKGGQVKNYYPVTQKPMLLYPRTNVCWIIALYEERQALAKTERIILGIDPGLANTGWGVVQQSGARLACVAYGCVSTPGSAELSQRLHKIYEQIGAVAERFKPTCVGIETVWFGQNITAAFATGQARGAALVACAEHNLAVGEFTPKQIKMAVVGTGSAEKDQVQYMVKQLLNLDAVPKPDHAADALAAAICYTTHEGFGAAGTGTGGSFDDVLAARGHVMAGAGSKIKEQQ